MRHKHYDLIISKAANMDLVAFCEHKENEWIECLEDFIDMHPSCNYFLCLPKYRDACRNWLSGGTSQYLSNTTNLWINFGGSKLWILTHLFMTNECEIRINPTKEKRWIAISKLDMNVMNDVFESVELAKEYCGNGKFSIHEIEVEATNG